MSPLAQVRTFFYKKYGFFCPFFASSLFNKFKRLAYRGLTQYVKIPIKALFALLLPTAQ